ncbi:amino acid transporter [Mycobacterium frederiksbergense]|uniref:Amino acid transporter n=1 Tax=Mycolicibacterium frederiksbergense TaxID=117567 RepID=A0ABT6L6N7_9MYCO|nr:APC family permease [Mycolicibacterium frederiksbergense]MDH6198607.1 amino acid transporter [Mycolicibacterium frederiksbergense]
MVTNEKPGGSLRRNALSVRHIVFFVVAAAAPLAVVVGVTPYAFAFGNGSGVPLTFIVVGALYLLFAVGYTAMSSHMGSAVSFYPYIARGLGKRTGVGSAFASLAAYAAVELMAMSLFGIYFSDSVQQWTGLHIPWLASCLLLNVVVTVAAMRNIEFSGKALGVFMICEVAVLGLLAVAILLAGGGPDGITLHGFGPGALTGGSGGLGVALVFIVSAFIGFEATAIFGQEARNPKKAVPAATYIAVLVIAGFYALCTWTISLDYGPSNIAGAAEANFTGLYQDAIRVHLGGGLFVLVLQVLMLTSLLACVLSFHNTINRYLWVIGRERVISPRFARTHDKHQSPHFAGGVQFVAIAGMVALFAALGFDPTSVVGWCSAFTAMGILIMQILVSVSVVRFFAADHRGVSPWRRSIAPTLSAITLFACLMLMVQHVDFVSGSESPIVMAFPLFVIALIVAGYIFATVLKHRRPKIYDQLGAELTTQTAREPLVES